MANKKRKCLYCKEYFEAESGIKLPAGFFCSFDHASQYAIERSKKALERKRRKETRESKERIKTKPDLIKETQAAVNAYVRFRDSNLECISCHRKPSNKLGGSMDAGHYRSRGAAGHLRFNLYNIHAQCVYCNRELSGNIVEYRKKLIDRIGLEKVERIENDNSLMKFDKEYLRRIRDIFRRRLRHLKKLRKNV